MRPDHRSAAGETFGGLLEQARRMGLARLDAQVLLAHAAGRSRTWLVAHADEAASPVLRESFEAACRQRLDGVPVAYLVGQREFYGLALAITPDVLDPRPDTEVLVDWALECLAGPLSARPRPVVVDLGTGSGAIALAVSHHCPRAQVIGTDRSGAALAVAALNGKRLGVPVQWREGDWLSALGEGERADLLVSNPPYIAEGDPHLPALRHEPLGALVAPQQGLADLRRIASAAPGHLHPGGWLLMEHAADQAGSVASLLLDAGFTSVSHRYVLAGHRRCTGGRLPEAR
jgi:release factor glutamine methyltransferase